MIMWHLPALYCNNTFSNIILFPDLTVEEVSEEDSPAALSAKEDNQYYWWHSKGYHIKVNSDIGDYSSTYDCIITQAVISPQYIASDIFINTLDYDTHCDIWLWLHKCLCLIIQQVRCPTIHYYPALCIMIINLSI